MAKHPPHDEEALLELGELLSSSLALRGLIIKLRQVAAIQERLVLQCDVSKGDREIIIQKARLEGALKLIKDFESEIGKPSKATQDS